jgi:hypothetical protein
VRASALFALASLAFAAPAAAQSIDDAAWLAGRWVGEGLGGKVEETWAPAAGGQMVGHFQLVKAGKPVFYEIMLLDARPGGLRLRVKHFNPDFTAWEDKAVWHSFEPVAVEPDTLRFKGLTLGRQGNRLTVTITFRGKDGMVRDEVLKLHRAPL